MVQEGWTDVPSDQDDGPIAVMRQAFREISRTLMSGWKPGTIASIRDMRGVSDQDGARVYRSYGRDEKDLFWWTGCGILHGAWRKKFHDGQSVCVHGPSQAGFFFFFPSLYLLSISDPPINPPESHFSGMYARVPGFQPAGPEWDLVGDVMMVLLSIGGDVRKASAMTTEDDCSATSF